MLAAKATFEGFEGIAEDTVDCRGVKVPRFTGELWTAQQRRGHSLHEVSYRACYKPQLPEFFLNHLLTSPGLIYDPFMGRGTTLLQAALMGHDVAGNDINPLSGILLAPRLDPPSADEVEERLGEIEWDDSAKADFDLSMFFSPKTEAQIVLLRRHLMERGDDADRVDRWIRMVATNRLTGHSPGFFSVYTMPPNQAVSPQSQVRINRRRKQTPPDRNVPELILRKSKSLLRHVAQTDLAALRRIGANARLLCEDSQGPVSLADESVDMVITSPPFMDTVQYAQDNWLRCWFNGIDAAEVGKSMTMERSLEGWLGAMRHVFEDLHRLVKADGWVAFEVGEVRGGKINLDEEIVPLGTSVGFQCECLLINAQRFTKTSNCWGVDNNRRGTNSNRIALFRKSGR